jgi:hypothetical protein
LKFDSVFIDDIDGPAIKTIDFLPESDKLKIEIKGLSFGIVLYGKFTLLDWFDFSFDDTYIYVEDFMVDLKLGVQSLSENQWYISEDTKFDFKSVEFEVQNEFLALILDWTHDYWKLFTQALLAMADESIYRALDKYNENAIDKKPES